MIHFLMSIQQSAFCQWVHSSPSLLAYPTILLLHVFGMGMVVSVCAGVDLRILGFAPAVPIAPMAKFIRFVWIGFWMNAVTGTILVAADAVNKLTNLDFYVKMLLVLLAVICTRMIEKRILQDPSANNGALPANAKALAFASLILWLGVMTSGRLLAYVGPGSGA
jgi:hypothetical protein